MDYREFSNIFWDFNNDKKYNKLKPNEKHSNFFLLQNRMSAYYPLHADLYNKLNINTAKVIDYWRNSLKKIYSKPPYWCFIKLNKKEKKATLKKKFDVDAWNPSKETVQFFLNIHKVGYREYNTLMDFEKETFKKYLYNLEEQIK